MEEVVPAICAGMVSTVICNPIDVIRINYQLNNKIKYDVSLFSKGILYGIITIPTFWAIYFPCYKYLSKEEIPRPISAYLSCCLASTITTPLWILRQKSQTDRLHIKTSFTKYYNGLLTTYLLNLSFVVQIPIYEYLKDKTDNSIFNTFLNVSFSKTAATCLFYPLDTIRARIRNSDPIRNLKIIDYYRGISVYLIRSIPYHSSVFCTFEFIKKFM